MLGATTAHAAITISAKPTRNMSCSAGTCTPTAKNAILNVSDLAGMLASGDVTVASGSKAKEIEIDAALSWIGASRLTLDSYRGIAVDKFVSIKGSGAVTLTTNDGGTGGDLDFEKSGRIAFWDMGSSLIINGAAYTLEPDFTTLAAAATADPSGKFALANNARARKKSYRNSPIDVTFEGTLEGLGNTISRLSLTPAHGTAAMITTLDASGTVRDLSLANLSIVAHANKPGSINRVGGVVGLTSGLIDGVHVSGTLNANDGAYFGLLAAYDSIGTIMRSSASGTITLTVGGSTVGGLVGVSLGDTAPYITWSHASVDITTSGNSYAGGLVGSGGNISDCYATGNVSGGLASGLIADFQGTITDSFATGNVTGTNGSGGLIGISVGPVVISHVYATGSVASSAYAGGLLSGKDGGELDQAYSIGAVTTTGRQTPGGLLALDDAGTISASVWDLDTSGITNPAQGAGSVANDPGITGLSDAALKSSLPAGFDPAVWGQSPSINNGYPYLLANPPPQ